MATYELVLGRTIRGLRGAGGVAPHGERRHRVAVRLRTSAPPGCAGGPGRTAPVAARRERHREKEDRKDGSRHDRRTIRKAPYVVNLTCGEPGPPRGLARVERDGYMAHTRASGDQCLS